VKTTPYRTPVPRPPPEPAECFYLVEDITVTVLRAFVLVLAMTCMILLFPMLFVLRKR
jgi:hypothetical protein